MTLGSRIQPILPDLRRYARLLTGTGFAGDALVRATLEAIVADPSVFPNDQEPRLGLYRVFDKIAGEVSFSSESDLPSMGEYRRKVSGAARLMRLASETRKQLLLKTVEQFTDKEIAYILDQPISSADSINLSVSAEQLGSGEAAAMRSVGKRAENKKDTVTLSLLPIRHAPETEVRNGKVQLSRTEIQLSSRTLINLDALRVDHLADVERIAKLGSNLGSGFEARVSVVIRLLADPLDEPSSLRLANQVRALIRMRAAIEEQLTAANAADILAVLDSLELFCAQFPAWLAFQSARSEPDAASAVQAINQMAMLTKESATAVSKDIIQALGEINPPEVHEQDSENLYLGSFVHNIFASIGRFLLDRTKGITASASKAFDEEIGKAIGSGLVNLVIAASTPLLALATSFPSHWAFAGPLVAAARLVLRQK